MSLDNAEEVMRQVLESHIKSALEELKQYENISPDQLQQYVKMRITLRALVSDPALFNELVKILPRTLGLKPSLEREKRNILIDKIEIGEDLLRTLRKKRFVRVTDILGKNSDTRDIYAYIALRKRGVLKRSKKGDFIVDNSLLDEKHVVDTPITVRDVERYLEEIPSGLWSRVVDYGFTQSMSNESLLEFSNRYYGRNRKVDEVLESSLAERVRRGFIPRVKPGSRLERLVEKIASRFTICHPRLIPYLGEDVVCDEEELARELRDLPLEEKWRIARAASKRKTFRNLLRRLDPITLSAINALKNQDDYLRAKIQLGKALINYLAYLLTDEVSALEYATYIASIITPEVLDPEYRPLLDSIVRGDSRRLVSYLARRSPLEAIEAISASLRNISYARGEVDEELVRKAVQLGLRIIDGLISKSGEIPVGREKSNINGRLAVRETIYNYLRQQTQTVFRREKKVPRVVAVVDVSGSMFRHALWTILSTATMTNIVAYVVIFSETPRVFKLNGRKIRSMLATYLREMFSAGFKGYTNITDALRAAEAVAQKIGGSMIVLISDLEQTVRNTEPWIVAKKIVGRGRTIIVLSPPGTNQSLIEEMEQAGCKVEIVPAPDKIPNILKRLIHFR